MTYVFCFRDNLFIFTCADVGVGLQEGYIRFNPLVEKLRHDVDVDEFVPRHDQHGHSPATAEDQDGVEDQTKQQQRQFRRLRPREERASVAVRGELRRVLQAGQGPILLHSGGNLRQPW